MSDNGQIAADPSAAEMELVDRALAFPEIATTASVLEVMRRLTEAQTAYSQMVAHDRIHYFATSLNSGPIRRLP